MVAPDDLLTTGEAAAELQVSVQTVRRWERQGDLRAVRTPGNQRRFRRSEVEALLAPAVPCPHPTCSNDKRKTFHFGDPCPYADEPQDGAA